MSLCNASLLQMIRLAVGQGVRRCKWQSDIVIVASKCCGAKRCGTSRHCYWQGLVVLVHGDI